MRRVMGQTSPDPLAVHTFTAAGEEIAMGEPWVTDEERAAAGRQTVADRSRELLDGNRRRAAEHHAAPQLPDGEDVVRVWFPRAPEALRARLGADPLAVWAEDDVLHVLWCGQADWIRLSAGIQPILWPVEAADDLWEASLRIRNLQQAVITITVMSTPTGAAPASQVVASLTWRGPQAPAMRPREVGDLAGTIQEKVLSAGRFGGGRPVTVYRPPGYHHGRPLPGCVLADGEATRGFAEVLEPAILDGSVPPLLLVGVHSGARTGAPRSDRRAQEYLPGWNRRRFEAHLDFVADEVIPWATADLDARPAAWVAAGFSNGAAWAIAAGQRRPELFTGVVAFSAGIVPRRIAGRARAAGVRHYLAAGVLEPGFRRATLEWAARLQRAGLPCHHREWVGGHDPLWWEQELPAALAWLLAGR
ncbi:MAG: alpha/beta hydrolase-fold protein [Candidatus Dormibacteraeota bacterium]|nr:alpha/beta hydrolase-fold protein [Candidatus Dormibacteraeota bacterium]